MGVQRQGPGTRGWRASGRASLSPCARPLVQSPFFLVFFFASPRSIWFPKRRERVTAPSTRRPISVAGPPASCSSLPTSGGQAVRPALTWWRREGRSGRSSRRARAATPITLMAAGSGCRLGRTCKPHFLAGLWFFCRPQRLFGLLVGLLLANGRRDGR